MPDYAKLYAPVACIQLVRTILSVAVSKIWEIEQVDVKGAFLHASLPESDRIHGNIGTVEAIQSSKSCTVLITEYGMYSRR